MNFLHGIPFEFVLFGLTLAGIVLFHRAAFVVALTGLASVVAYKMAATGFAEGAGLGGFAAHIVHELPILLNLFALLTGFALLARHFELSRVPDEMPAILPDDWTGGLMLLGIVFVISAFLDNIAAAVIGGTMARAVFKDRVHIGFLAAIVASSNAGGSGSVIGDTTTTMMWVSGVSPFDVLHAYIAAVTAFFVFAIPAARTQHAYQPIEKDPPAGLKVDWAYLAIAAIVLIAAIVANVGCNAFAPELMTTIPVLGLTVWAALLATSLWRAPDYSVLPEAAKGAVFLLSLVLTASLMPVSALPSPSWHSVLALGFVSSVFDNIPLTALAIKQGGYDWGLLAYAVGFGGSMLWFGSSAGVALANAFPEAKSALVWIRHGWPVALAYVVGFFVMLALWGWHPGPGGG